MVLLGKKKVNLNIVCDRILNDAKDLSAAYDVIQSKGGTLPQIRSVQNLSAAIYSIPSGTVKAVSPMMSVSQPEYTDQDVQSFRSACYDFRNICIVIRDFIEDESFIGDLDQITEIADSEFAETNNGMMLINRLNAQNSLCQNLAQKIGLDHDQWLKRCWEYQDEEDDENN